ncbi:MAG: response regulator transcription factor [Armatimonadota bacterium]|nr:response regulator transcription factor [Armatimonadota bacterium]
MQQKILVVEDEAVIAAGLEFSLRQEGYEVELAYDARTALEVFRRDPPALVLLDLMLPDADGLDLCRALRAHSDVPVIMVTARDQEAEKVRGLEAGADDYVTKPFGVMELLARIRTALRRSSASARSRVVAGPVEIDRESRTVRVGDTPVELRRREFDLLWALASAPGRVHTRDDLLATVWEDREYVEPGTLDVHIRRLREKIEPDPSRPRHITTVRGVGYRFET